ncbi:MAG: hypothetical protein GEU87_17930 [Alphaproteobacteria bacterium]|nr:hypothetical protein [Alphaproteobacteria bacterium]
MSDNGFTKSYRRRWNHPAFRDYVEAAVWAWMTDTAAWQPKRLASKFGPVNLERGQLLISERGIAKKFRMGRKAFRGILQRLVDEQMVVLNSNHPAPNAGTIVTIINYNKYQSHVMATDDDPTHRSGNCEPPENHLRTTSGPQGKGEKERKEEKKQEGAPDGATAGRAYAFERTTVRLTHQHYREWQKMCPTLVKLELFDGTLISRDQWYERPENIDKRKRWFYPTSNYMRTQDQKAAVALQTSSGRGRPAQPHWVGEDYIAPDLVGREAPFD